MERITITIHRLGAIKDSVIDMKPIMVFSGESGLGKSYVAMLCNYIFTVLLDKERFNRFFIQKGLVFNEMRAKLHNQGELFVLTKKEIEDFLAEDALSYLKYMLNSDQLEGDIEINLPNTVPSEIKASYEEEILGLQNNEEVYLKLSMLDLFYRAKDDTLGNESPYAFLLRYGLIGKIFGDFKKLTDTFVLPPSRGPVLTEILDPISGLYAQFAKGLYKINRAQPHPEKNSEELVKLFSGILDGSIYREADKYYYRSNGKDLPISAAASSIREIAPLALLVERYDVGTISILFEEPEAHLHPLKQRMMADIISALNNAGAYMQITTHSDYLLRRINELINLQRIYLKYQDSTEFEKICKECKIPSCLKFDFSRLGAYLLNRNSDGSSNIVPQDVEDGIPFSSFTDALNVSLANGYRLNEYLENEDC